MVRLKVFYLTRISNMNKLPSNLSPLFTDHPSSCAYRITLSSHEWTWTQKEQEEMARTIVQLDIERNKKVIKKHKKKKCLIKNIIDGLIGVWDNGKLTGIK